MQQCLVPTCRYFQSETTRTFETMIKTRISAPAATVTLAFALSVFAPAWVSAQTLPSAGPLATAIDEGARTVGKSQAAAAPQPSQTPVAKSANDMKVAIYPVLIWVPSFGAKADVPPFPDVPGGPDLPGESGSTSASIDGAALAGFTLAKARWRVDVEGIWGALTTKRETPLLEVDLDIIYGHASGGVKVYKDLYVTAGVRRLALKYDITLGTRPSFVRKPGLWDPLVGLGWHGALGPRWDMHVSGEGGGFGVGADVDLSVTARADWKMFHHVGLTFGYNVLYLKVSDTVLQRTLTVKQTIQGPVLGFGLYF
jgi:hypothetical protein